MRLVKTFRARYLVPHWASAEEVAALRLLLCITVLAHTFTKPASSHHQGTIIMDDNARVLLDLQQMHGTSELKLGQTFNSGSLATKFLQGYCFNANKKCRLARGSGKSNTYKCSDDKCTWEVRVYRRQVIDGVSVMHTSFIRDKHHDFCTSIAMPTERQIQLLPTFRAAIVGDRGVKRKSVVSMVQSRDLVNLENCKSKLHRAKDAVIDSLDGEWEASFSYIPSLLAELRDRNPQTTVSLDVDQHQRFLRVFVAFGSSAAVQPHLQPLLGFDGAHSKHSKYNGVVLSLLGRDGNGQNVTLALAFVNVKNERNILWFFELCIQAGIKVDAVPIFRDRGKIIAAAESLYARSGLALELRFCTVHIIRNIKRHCRLSGRAVENAVWKVQASPTSLDYTNATADLRDKFGNAMGDYVARINPARWTVHGNMPEFVASAWEDDCVPTRPCPLFGWRSSNFVESDNSSMLHHGIRDAAPYEALARFASVEMERYSSRDLLASQWHQANRVLTPFAKGLWEKERARVGEYSVRRLSATVSFVAHANSSLYRRVDTSKPSCSCPTYRQQMIACRHIVAALQFDPEVCLNAFHTSYLVQTFVAAFEGRYIEVPLRTTTTPSEVAPSPIYKQAGRRITRRAASAGETEAKSTYVCAVCKERGYNKRTCRRHANESEEANDQLVPHPAAIPEYSDRVVSISGNTVSRGPAGVVADARHDIAFLLS